MSAKRMADADTQRPTADTQEGSTDQQHDEDTKTLFRDLVKMVNHLESRVDELETKVNQDNKKIVDEVMTRVDEKLETEREKTEEAIKEVHIGRAQEISNVKLKLKDEIEDVRSDLKSEQQTRSQADSQIRARMTLVESEMDGDIDEAQLIEQDKLTRIIKNGVDDVEQNPTKADRRAEDILTSLNDWGNYRTDSNGDRVILYQKDVRDFMRERYGKPKLQSVQAGRAFDSLMTFAEDSPRRVRKRNPTDGRAHLVVFQPDQLLEAAEGVSR